MSEKPKIETATSRHSDKLAGNLTHPADDRQAAKPKRKREAPSRYGETLAGHLKPDSRPAPIEKPDPRAGRLKHLGGSQNDNFNADILNSATKTLWANSHFDDQDRMMNFVANGLAGVAPKDAIEGMLAAQMVATHAAAMECHRRAMLPQQTTPARAENLTQAAKASRTFATLLEALDRHRGKGGQKVLVKHVHVHEGGQAIVGNVEHPSGGGGRASFENRSQSYAQPAALAHAPVAPLWSEGPDEGREPVPIAGDGEREMQDARGHRGRADG